MTRIVLLLLMVWIPNNLSAQIGMRIGYRQADAPKWDALLGDYQSIIKHGHSLSFDYRLPLKNYGVAVSPEIGFASFQNDERYPIYEQGVAIIGQFFNFNGSVQIFPFDFFRQLSDKEQLLPSQKALKTVFVEAGMGCSMVYMSFRQLPEGAQLPPRQVVINSVIGAGFTIDYGAVSLSPVVRMAYLPSVTWEGLTDLRTAVSRPDLSNKSRITQFEFALRFGMRLKK